MKKHAVSFLWNTFLLFAGCSLCAFSVCGIILPQKFIIGGLTGVSLVIYYHFPSFPLGLIYWALNIPIFIIGWRFVGKRFVLYSAWGMAIYGILLSIFPWRLDIKDPLLSVIVAAVISGIGFAIILRSYGSTGGADILCVIMNKMLSIPLGTGAFLINAVVVVIAARFFSLEKVLYAAVFILISTLVTNKVFHGLSQRRAVLIISDRWKEIADEFTRSCRTGMTFINGKGCYKGADKTILYSVVNRSMVSEVKRIAKEKDPHAFVSIMEAVDVTSVEVGNQPHW
ncbi:YitT family protein [Elusimicrobiota bacterium]